MTKFWCSHPVIPWIQYSTYDCLVIVLTSNNLYLEPRCFSKNLAFDHLPFYPRLRIAAWTFDDFYPRPQYPTVTYQPPTISIWGTATHPFSSPYNSETHNPFLQHDSMNPHATFNSYHSSMLHNHKTYMLLFQLNNISVYHKTTNIHDHIR